MTKQDSYLICPKCTCVLDLDCYPKCLICNTLKQCINCTSNDQIMAVDYLVLTVCYDCLINFEEDQFKTVMKQFKVKKSEMAKRIMRLKKQYQRNICTMDIEIDLDTYIIKLNE